MSDWQPIEDAPRDGSTVQLRFRYGDGGTALIAPKARRFGMGWQIADYDGKWRSPSVNTLPFRALGWRHAPNPAP